MMAQWIKHLPGHVRTGVLILRMHVKKTKNKKQAPGLPVILTLRNGDGIPCNKMAHRLGKAGGLWAHQETLPQ